MTLATMRRLPGFAFEARTAVYEDVLPRMDVAVFVGVAARGPVNVPVPIEDAARFVTVFGGDAPLAWDVETGRIAFAQLAPAVRLFFANGGRRCWVIRVARSAQSNVLPVPGIVVTTGDDPGDLAPLTLDARSPGRWADGVAMSASLTSRRIGVLTWAPDSRSFTVLPGVARDLGTGDLLRVNWLDDKIELYARVVKVSSVGADRDAGLPESIRVELDGARWFDTVRQPFELEGTARLAQGAVPARFVDAGSPSDGSDDLTIALTIAPEDSPPTGTIIVAIFDGETVVVSVRDVWVAAEDQGSPRGADVHIRGKALWARHMPQAGAHVSPPERPRITVERLGLDLWARDTGGDQPQRVGDVGLAPGHPRHLAMLPDDATAYGGAVWDDEATWSDALTPRFPAAGAYQPRTLSETRPLALPLCIPLGVTALPEHYLPSRGTTDHPLVRDGLMQFDAALFADEELAPSLSTTLVSDAEYVRFLAPVPRSLVGLHAALAIEEATLIAVPDATLRGWSEDLPLPADITTFDVHEPCEDDGRFDACDALACPPVLTAIGSSDSIALTWTAPTHRGPFVVQRATDAEWADAAAVFEGWAHTVRIAEPAVGTSYYRVRGLGDRPTAWSNGIAARVAIAGGWRLSPVHKYRDDVLVAVHRLLLRLCAARRDVMAVLSMPEHYREDAASAHVHLLAAETARPLDVGSSIVRPIGSGERDALDFGAVYHGWVFTRSETGDLRALAPDGAACGVIARRAIERGAWVAPANELLRAVVALERPASSSRWQELQDARVNVIRHLPHGFAVMSADTLATDEDVRPISVRRLLILLRRMATRRGATYVFEPNDDAFRRMVQRGFEDMLGDLFQRGAFAGATAGSGFQVVTDASLNTPQSIDQGRFIVELRVAPSRPMTFLTLRLVQTGARITVTGA